MGLSAVLSARVSTLLWVVLPVVGGRPGVVVFLAGGNALRVSRATGLLRKWALRVSLCWLCGDSRAGVPVRNQGLKSSRMWFVTK